MKRALSNTWLENEASVPSDKHTETRQSYIAGQVCSVVGILMNSQDAMQQRYALDQLRHLASHEDDDIRNSIQQHGGNVLLQLLSSQDPATKLVARDVLWNVCDDADHEMMAYLQTVV